MKHLARCMLVICLAVFMGFSFAGCDKPKESKFNILVFEDNFDGTALNEDNWNYQTGNGSDYGIFNWGNNEAQIYKKDNVTVSGGFLKITAKSEDTLLDGRTYNYTSARITTAGKVSARYGRIEARIKLPVGNGLWPAFWMLPETNSPHGSWPASGEIDIMEAKGRYPDRSSAAIHYGADIYRHEYQTDELIYSNGKRIDEFRVYAVEWEPEVMRFYVDDIMFFEAAAWHSKDKSDFPAPFDTDFHILLNLAVGGNFDGGIIPTDTDLPAVMEVDYVRIYESE